LVTSGTRPGVDGMCGSTQSEESRVSALSDSDVGRLAFLESVERGWGLPDGCDIQSLVALGLLELRHDGWTLTTNGKLALANLRSTAERPY